VDLKKKCKQILVQAAELTEILELIGKDSLGESDKVTLAVARIIKDDFLQQNMFANFDSYCPFYKTVWMLKNIMTFHDLAQKAVESTGCNKVTWAIIQTQMGDVIQQLTYQKFQEPSGGQQNVEAHMNSLNAEIHSRFQQLDN